MERERILAFRHTVQQFIRSFGLLEQATTPCGFSMSLSQVFALQELEKETLTITELALRLQLERSSVSRLIDGLVNGGFVSRELNASNRREVILALTEKGERSVRAVRDQSVRFYESILGHMSEPERMMLFEGFQSFANALSEVRRS
ncbi:MarR family transcriptional regulator [Cohnella sp. CFH 77786]|uniref:MarR family winged helix-turn-helix transcriptional regulator n=1 Tax=Cohnella sp. CFH 77786 TaxID=2662265 RepID=UPI001C60C7D5|nr:MarR family transcriptional regulator [Cohnella sp. CFH 77786]MBW5445364.1 MarR family transcriptional regulator [Cohnella sp. CFH 77786]